MSNRKPSKARYLRTLDFLVNVEYHILKPTENTGKARREAYNAADIQTQIICDRMRDQWLEVMRLGFRR